MIFHCRVHHWMLSLQVTSSRQDSSWIPHIHGGKLNDLRPGFPFDLLILAAFVDTWRCQKHQKLRLRAAVGSLMNLFGKFYWSWLNRLALWKKNKSRGSSLHFCYRSVNAQGQLVKHVHREKNLRRDGNRMFFWWSSPWFRQKKPGFLHPMGDFWQGSVAVS